MKLSAEQVAGIKAKLAAMDIETRKQAIEKLREKYGISIGGETKAPEPEPAAEPEDSNDDKPLPDPSSVLAEVIALRDKIDGTNKLVKQKLQPLVDKKEKLEAKLLAHLRATNTSTSKFDGVGTLTAAKKTIIAVDDWDAYYKKMIELGRPDMLQKSVNQGVVKDMLAEDPDLVLPIQMHHTQTLRITKAKKEAD